MVIYIPTAVIFVYLLLRLILPLKIDKKKKVALGLLLFFVSQGHLLRRLFFGGLSSPELPAPVLMIQGGLFVALLFMLLLVVGRDLYLLLKKIVRPRPTTAEATVSPGRRRFLATGLRSLPAALAARQALVPGLVMLPAAYGVSQAVAVPQLRTLTLRLPKLPPELDGLVLVQISDLHVSPLLKGDWVEAVVRRVNEARPDLILFTGDMVDGLPADRADSMTPLKNLQSRYGVYACAGNHEYYNGFHSWMEFFPQLGLTTLLNNHQVLNINGRELVVAGLTDPVALRFSLPGPDLAAALKGSPEKAVRILLDHRPGQAPLNAEAGIDLQLSGHTHGGQMPIMSQLVAAANGGFLRGLYNVRSMPLYVNSGAGLWNGFPVRLGVPGEIARIVLQRSVAS